MSKKKKKGTRLFLLCVETHTFSPDKKFHTVNVYWELEKIEKREGEGRRGKENRGRKKGRQKER